MREAGARLRFLHGSGLACSARMPLDEHLSEIEKKAGKLAMVQPELTRRLDAVLAALAQRAADWGHAGVVHGDFHSRQLMVAGFSVALFDYDEIGRGDVLEDFGSFAADLTASGREARSHLRWLLEGYGTTVPAEGVAWHMAVQLLTRAYRGLLQLRPDFAERTQRCLSLAEEALA
jgi:aminoglycoside phosphotransferase (APT) family kinase protein